MNRCEDHLLVLNYWLLSCIEVTSPDLLVQKPRYLSMSIFHRNFPVLNSTLVGPVSLLLLEDRPGLDHSILPICSGYFFDKLDNVIVFLVLFRSIVVKDYHSCFLN